MWFYRHRPWSHNRIEHLGMTADETFWAAPWDEIEDKCGGCGPGKWGDLAVPDTMYGLDVKGACIVHDWDYYLVACGERPMVYRVEGDDRFLDNLECIIRAKSRFFLLRWLRLRRAYTYYLMVAELGDHFIRNKQMLAKRKDEIWVSLRS